jgi:hypothetical protein
MNNETTNEALARLRRREAIRQSAGAWTDENHPDLVTDEDMGRYLSGIRATFQRLRVPRAI